MADEGQAATDQQAAEETAHPAVTGGLEECRADVAGGAAETQRPPLVGGGGDVQRPSGQHREAQSGGVAHLDQSGTALVALGQLGAANGGELAHVADQPQQLRLRVVASKQMRHARSSRGRAAPRRVGMWRGSLGAAYE